MPLLAHCSVASRTLLSIVHEPIARRHDQTHPLLIASIHEPLTVESALFFGRWVFALLSWWLKVPAMSYHSTPLAYDAERVCSLFDTNPCGVGACVNDNLGGYSCVCPAGFSSNYKSDRTTTCLPGRQLSLVTARCGPHLTGKDPTGACRKQQKPDLRVLPGASIAPDPGLHLTMPGSHSLTTVSV